MAEGETRVATALSNGTAHPPGRTATPTSGSQTRETSSITGRPLPEGYTYDGNGRLHGPDGNYIKDPTAPPDAHNRDSEYPGGFRESTHHEMARRYTVEGRRHGSWPVDSDGNRVPRDTLTWIDARGRRIRVPPGDVITYDHVHPAVQNWNDTGRLNNRGYRNDWYNNADNLRPVLRSQNSSDGAKLGIRYRQDTGGDYAPD